MRHSSIDTRNAFTRRQAMAALLALPLGARLAAQVKPGPKPRVIQGNSDGILLMSDGTMHMWVGNPASMLPPARSASVITTRSPRSRWPPSVESIACRHETTTAVLSSGRIMTWGEVREFQRADGRSIYSPAPIPLNVDGLDNA